MRILAKRTIKIHGPFILALILAVVFRFTLLTERPFDSDELGAIFRAENAETFSKHIDKGVRIDGHPALVQTFLWMNQQWGIISILNLKFLWTSISLLSIVFYYVYFTRRLGFKPAFFIAASLLFLFWPATMGQWVRPYTIGFLWLSILSFSLTIRRGAIAKVFLASIGLAMAAYSHYFAGLTGFLILLLDAKMLKTNYKEVLLISAGSFLLFSPHLGVFLDQLEIGGLTWLSAPDISFIGDHFFHVFNGSHLIILEIILALTVQLLWIFWKKKPLKPYQNSIFTLGVWAIIFIIGFSYSKLSKPVLHDNVMYFALPFFIGSIANFFRFAPPYIMRLCAVIWVSSLCYSSIMEKGYYSTALINKYHFPIKTIAQNPPTLNTGIIIDGPSDVFQYHLQGKPFNATLLQEKLNASQYMDSITRYSVDTNIFVLNSGTDMQIITAMYSRLHLIPMQKEGPIRSFYQGGELFKATRESIPFWESQPHMTITLSSEKPSFVEFKSIIKELGPIDRNDILFISIIDSSLSQPKYEPRHLISALFQKGFNQTLQQIDYRYTSNDQQLNVDDSLLHHAIKLSDIKYWNQENMLRISYEYRGNATPLNQTYSCIITKIKGNPYLYGYPTKQTL
jgi:hypothetical protein